MSKPLLLICNDDGIHAPGIRALVEAVKDLGDLVVVEVEALVDLAAEAVAAVAQVAIGNQMPSTTHSSKLS
jgi:hypothetical protein